MFHNFFIKLTENHTSLIFIIVADWKGGGGCNLIKEETPAQVFSCEFWDIFENTSFKEYFQTTASIAITWNTK